MKAKIPVCHWCGEELVWSAFKGGWRHLNGELYKKKPDGGDDHCALVEWREAK